MSPLGRAIIGAMGSGKPIQAAISRAVPKEPEARKSAGQPYLGRRTAANELANGEVPAALVSQNTARKDEIVQSYKGA